MKRKTALIDPVLKRSLTNPFAALDTPWRDPTFPLAKAKKLWSLIRDETIEEWAQRLPGKRPWPFWRFEHGMDPPGDQAAYLAKHNLLTDEEKTTLERTTHENA